MVGLAGFDRKIENKASGRSDAGIVPMTKRIDHIKRRCFKEKSRILKREGECLDTDGHGNSVLVTFDQVPVGFITEAHMEPDFL